MSNTDSKVIGRNSVVRVFGYWPEFSDGEIINISFKKYGDIPNQYSTVEMIVRYSDNDTSKVADVLFELAKVGKFNFHKLHSQNVIDKLEINEYENVVHIDIESCIGLEGDCICELLTIKVVEN